MQLTSLLSDLNSLRACDPTAALKLVALRPSASPTFAQSLSSPASALQESDPDLARPSNLLYLHRTVKLAFASSASSGRRSTLSDLRDAREDVRKVLIGLGQDGSRSGERHHVSEAGEGEDPLNAEDDEEVAAWS